MVPEGTPLPDLSNQQSAYPVWLPKGFDELQRVQVQLDGVSVYLRAHPAKAVIQVSLS